MDVIIRPSRAVGTVAAPPSKSMAHRLLIGAGLSAGESVVRNLAYSKDIKATIACLRALGADIRTDGDTATIRGINFRDCAEKSDLYCNESGSTLRFFIPLCLLDEERRTLRGSRYLFTRPLSVYEEIASAQGIEFIKSADSLTVQGKLHSGVYEIPGNISSQFVTGLLFALPLVDGDSELRLIPPVESRPYIDMTVATLRVYGVKVRADGDRYFIQGNQTYTPADVVVEGDYSNAAFFEALNVAGSSVTVTSLKEDSLQGDKVYKILFEKIKRHEGTVDIADCPDLGPVLFAVAALCGGGEFTGTRRLKMKESDRAAAMRDELEKLGVTLTVGENDVSVSGALHAPIEALCGHGDHRIVMALAVLCTVTGGVITGAEAVEKSFPDFFDRLTELGVDIRYGMDQ